MPFTLRRKPADERLTRALRSLRALSYGDALGEAFFGHPEEVALRLEERRLPAEPRRWTDDTLMACSVVACLDATGRIDPDRLLHSFADRYEQGRGYGHRTRDLLGEVRRGLRPPRTVSVSGSYGNGAAMRVAPVGAFHAGDPVTAAAVAATQAVTTHTHPEAVAGATAVAVAASLVADGVSTFDELLTAVVAHTPASRVRDGLVTAAELGRAAPVTDAAAVLGTGFEAAAFDTVPFALWSAAQSIDDLEAVFWRTVSGLGDRDTTCAIACGVSGARSPLPPAWAGLAIEALPAWL